MLIWRRGAWRSHCRHVAWVICEDPLWMFVMRVAVEFAWPRKVSDTAKLLTKSIECRSKATIRRRLIMTGLNTPFRQGLEDHSCGCTVAPTVGDSCREQTARELRVRSHESASITAIADAFFTGVLVWHAAIMESSHCEEVL